MSAASARAGRKIFPKRRAIFNSKKSESHFNNSHGSRSEKFMRPHLRHPLRKPQDSTARTRCTKFVVRHLGHVFDLDRQSPLTSRKSPSLLSRLARYMPAFPSSSYANEPDIRR